MFNIKTSRPFLMIALALPIIALLLMTQAKQQHLQQGTLITLPISGFDPRDLLSGHYLRYQIDYGFSINCPQDEQKAAWLCLQPHTQFYTDTDELALHAQCKTRLKGSCKAGDFVAGIERFYIPEEYARPLDQLVRGKKGKIIIAVDNGEALVKELLINDQPWREFMQAQEENP